MPPVSQFGHSREPVRRELSWHALGRSLASLWRCLALLGALGSILGGFWVAFGEVLERFGQFWEGLCGRVLGGDNGIKRLMHESFWFSNAVFTLLRLAWDTLTVFSKLGPPRCLASPPRSVTIFLLDALFWLPCASFRLLIQLHEG